MVMFALFYEGSMPTLESFIAGVVAFDNVEFMIAYCIVAAIFGLQVFAFSVVSLPLMLDRGRDAVTAMIASFLALVRNPAAMFVWGALIVGLVAIGTVTGFLGFIVVGPVLGHATWQAYREIVAHPEQPA